MSIPTWLGTAVRRSHGEAGMLGYVFARYRELEDRTEVALATELGCTLDALQWMSLCRRPLGEALSEQASTIAERFSVKLRPLVHVLRRVDVLDALSERRGSHGGNTLRMAARDDEIH